MWGVKKAIKFWFLGLFGFVFSVNILFASSGRNSVFYQNLNQLLVPVEAILRQKTLSRYQLTRLLNAVECYDCIVPDKKTHDKYSEAFWTGFVSLPGKDFRDIEYLSWKYQGVNYYYCVAKVGNDDTMRGYPVATSNICAGKFCGSRDISKAEFFQTLLNLLTDRIKGNYSAPWKDIKEWVNKRDKKSYEYKVFTTAEIDLINRKENQTEKIQSRLEFSTYLKYCMFHPNECGFQTFPTLPKGYWPLSEMNILIQAGIITPQDVEGFSKPISTEDALKKLDLLYELHIQCALNVDYDCDGLVNHEDNCPYAYNPGQNDMDSNGIGDVCSDDIDGDGKKNPLGLVDDTWNINYSVLMKEKSEDPTPLGEDTREDLYFIKVSKLDNDLPSLVKFEITSREAPLAVEWDFGDFTKGKGIKTQHIYTAPGLMTVIAKVTTKGGKVFVLTQQLSLGQPQSTMYWLSIKLENLDSANKKAVFKPEFMGKFDYFQRENTANWHKENTISDASFTAPLENNQRNNITLKGYVQGKLVAVASIDILDQNWTFFGFSPEYSPHLKTTTTKMMTTLRLQNLSLGAIDSVKWDFGDGTNFIDRKLVATHTYTDPWNKVLIQKIHLKDGKELISTSFMTLRSLEEIWNQAINIIPTYNDKGELALSLQAHWAVSSDQITSLTTLVNNKNSFFTQKPQLNAPFFSVKNRQGQVKVTNKFRIGSRLQLENRGIAVFDLQSNAQNAFSLDPQSAFSWLKCDFDHDGIPDLYDDDIDGDGIKNLLGMVYYERPDCKLIVGDNIDQPRYSAHFWICSLDNCPIEVNTDQDDLNANGIGDICEQKDPDCWNGVIDKGETCKTCPQDVGPCTAFCDNGKIEAAETCKNCEKDVKICLVSCGNGKIEEGEICDDGDQNFHNGKCSVDCKPMDPKKPLCGNGEIDLWEDCKNCPEDLKDICIDDGNKKPKCWNGEVDPWENCSNCYQDVPNCDEDEDWCPDPEDPCPKLPGNNGSCCPKIPEPCEDWECPLVTPLCNQCPCQYADYSNTLQNNDSVRARLWDQGFKVHYDYSKFAAIKNFLKRE